MVRLDVRQSRELRATIFALRAIDTTLAKQIRQQVKALGTPQWRDELARRATTQLEQRVIADTAVVSVSNQNVRLQSAGKGRPLSGGLNPKRDYLPIAWGASPSRTTYTRHTKHGTHKVTRNTHAPFKRPLRGGYVFRPAAEAMVSRFASLFVQTTVRTIATALEGRKE